MEIFSSTIDFAQGNADRLTVLVRSWILAAAASWLAARVSSHILAARGGCEHRSPCWLLSVVRGQCAFTSEAWECIKPSLCSLQPWCPAQAQAGRRLLPLDCHTPATLLSTLSLPLVHLSPGLSSTL